ncbi:Histidinol-phosphatase [Aquimixticola soesokkakensis]|uniref:Histidinol-phosphatase n=1 Tax=Aquimixticola soesokkakensis TaxID=1519096 RepID=A0A1Y5SVE9_9RHOB|nr:histidinol-phosphatase [Aquimixticola soesokkakensis]SLN49204.1 Histidinol-phosphatase [Aquimixticola soesokkakensis]
MPSNLPDPQTRAALIATAHAAADIARDITLQYFRTDRLATESKRADFDPVTQADKGAEAAMRALIHDMRPEDAILGEEAGFEAGTSGYTWVLDPVDGTRGFISGTPTWGVLIGLRDAAGPIYGIVDQPYIGERFEGGLGRATLAGPRGTQALETRQVSDLSEAFLFSTFPEVGTAQERAGFEAVSQRVKLTRFGMDCYAYALVAAGQVDLVIEAGLQSYDILAPIAVIEAAGGIVTDWQGNPAHDGGRVLACANKALHAQALAVLSTF